MGGSTPGWEGPHLWITCICPQEPRLVVAAELSEARSVSRSTSTRSLAPTALQVVQGMCFCNPSAAEAGGDCLPCAGQLHMLTASFWAVRVPVQRSKGESTGPPTFSEVIRAVWSVRQTPQDGRQAREALWLHCQHLKFQISAAS